MLLEKQIIVWKNDSGLTDDMLDVLMLPHADFPRLIFQDFMNQLKIPKLKLGFELNTSTLFEVEPQNLENLDDSVRFELSKKNTLNLSDVLMYYLLTKVLKADFNLTYIYTNNHVKSKLYFKCLMPFSTTNNADLSSIKKIVKAMKPKEVQFTLERFFVLLGPQYKDKLMLFLTYLDQKYKFKVDKTDFIQSTLGEKNLMKVEQHLNQIL